MKKPVLLSKTITGKKTDARRYIVFQYDIEGGGVKYANVQKWVNQFAQKLGKDKKFRGRRIYSSVLYSDIGQFRGGTASTIDKNTQVDVFNPDKYYDDITKHGVKNKITRFNIIVEQLKKKGGTSKKNDCLFKYCLMPAVQNRRALLPRELQSARKVKEFLYLNRNDEIHIEYIPILEDKLKWCIDVSGDYVRVSDKFYPFKIHIKIVNGHYTLVRNKDMNDMCIRKPTEKENVCSVEFITFDKVNVYDGNKLKSMSTDEFNIFKKTHLFITTKKPFTIEQTYNNFIEDQSVLYCASDKFINLFNYPNLLFATFGIWTMKTKGISMPDEITPMEAKFINGAFCGGLIWAEEKYKGKLYECDINSAYPSALKYQFRCMTSEGQFMKMTNQEFDEKMTNPEQHFQVGIYHAKIKKHEDESMNKLFRFNPKNYYTQYDLRFAKENNFKASIIQDDESNALIYDKDSGIDGSKMFKPFVEYMFELRDKLPKWYREKCKKEERSDICKQILNLLWGALCKRLTERKIVNIKDSFDVFGGKEILQFDGDENFERLSVKYSNGDKPFQFPFARIAPFVTARVRYNLGNTMVEHRHHIKRIHTDGFYIDKKIELDYGTELGQYKCIDHGMCKVHNVNHVETEK